ncbi:hypothetical protein JXA80_07895 [bacterium]|nr:hypothetical protein [candidate division CSSED10-310 bacterium]
MSTDELPVFTVVHSRQPAWTCTGAPWIRMTERILSDHDPGSEVLVTSAGMLHYDVPLRMWLHRGGRCRVILPMPFEHWTRDIQREYAWLTTDPIIELLSIDRLSEQPHNPRPRTPALPSHERMAIRDRIVLNAAERIEIGCIDPQGRMRQLLRDIRKRGQKVIRRRLTRSEQLAPAVSPIPRYNVTRDMPGFDTCLWHFTRTRSAPWPGETRAHYIDDLCGFRTEHAPYSAQQSLDRILTARRIEPGDRLIRGRYDVVSFTSASWQVIKNLFSWQSHLRRVRFEPFAVGIRRTDADAVGLKPVIYGRPPDYARLPESSRWRFQNRGSGMVDWTEEKEWRCKGPLDWSRSEMDCILCLTPEGIRQLNP